MIELCDICKSFGKRNVIDRLNLKIYPNQVTFIVGTSGAGKSTLLNMIGGLSLPDRGNIVFDGVNIADNIDTYRGENVGFIFQNYNLISGLSVKDNIKIGALYSNSPNAFDNSFDQLLEDIGILDLNQSVDTLSGGEKQRVSFARSICKSSKIIIADEPTGNLDSDNAEKIFSLLSEYKENRYIIIVTHDIDKAQKYGDRIISLKDGKIESDITIKKEIIEDDISNATKWCQKRKRNICWTACNILGMNNVRRKWWRVLSIALVVALTITAITTVICLGSWGNTVSDRVNKDYLENDLLSLYYSLMPNSALGSYPFSGEVIEEIKKEYEISEIVEEYFMNIDDSLMLSYGSNISKASFKQINISEFFEKRTMSNEIEGRFIANEDEIIISSEISKLLFNGAGIGEKIQINTPNGHSKELEVVGINYTQNPFDEVYTFICSSALEQLLVEEIKEELDSIVSVSEFRDEITHDIISGGFHGYLDTFDGNEKIVFQTEEQFNENSVLLSSALAEAICESNHLSPSAEIYNTDYVISTNGEFKIRVVGVYESDEYEFRISEALYSKILSADPIKLEIYLVNSNEVTAIFNEINEEGTFFSECTLENLKSNIHDQTSYFKAAIILFGLILLIISFFMLSSFAKISVLERKHEFAIVKSLGASNMDLRYILLLDAIVISIVSIAISFIATGVVIKVIPLCMEEISYISFDYPWVVEMCISVIFSLITTAYNVIYFRKISKMMPADLLVAN